MLTAELPLRRMFATKGDGGPPELTPGAQYSLEVRDTITGGLA